MSRSPLIDMDRIEKLANAVVDSVKQLESSVDTAGTKLTAAELRKQTLGIYCRTGTPYICSS